MSSGVELANQFAIARRMNRFPSEIGHISSLEFGRLEDEIHAEAQQAEAQRRDAERQEWLRRA